MGATPKNTKYYKFLSREQKWRRKQDTTQISIRDVITRQYYVIQKPK